MHDTEVASRLRRASHALCAMGDIQTRLEAAYAPLSEIAPDALTGSFAVRFGELVADLTYGGESITEALSHMNAHDQVRLAERIVSLYGEVCLGLAHDD